MCSSILFSFVQRKVNVTSPDGSSFSHRGEGGGGGEPPEEEPSYRSYVLKIRFLVHKFHALLFHQHYSDKGVSWYSNCFSFFPQHYITIFLMHNFRVLGE